MLIESLPEPVLASGVNAIERISVGISGISFKRVDTGAYRRVESASRTTRTPRTLFTRDTGDAGAVKAAERARENRRIEERGRGARIVGIWDEARVRQRGEGTRERNGDIPWTVIPKAASRSNRSINPRHIFINISEGCPVVRRALSVPP